MVPAVIGAGYRQNSLAWFRALQGSGTLGLIDDEELKADLIESHDGDLAYLAGLSEVLDGTERRLFDVVETYFAPVSGDTTTAFESGGSEWRTRNSEWVLQVPVE